MSFRERFTWDTLWRYSQAQIVTYACFATLAIPIFAQLVLFVREAQMHVSALDRNWTWRLFAAELYYAGLLMLVARSLVQVFCPRRIQRFPLEDEHFLYVTTIRTTTKGLGNADETAPHAPAERSGAEKLAGALQPRLDSEITDPATAKKDWELEAARYPLLRWLIGLLYSIGTAGVLLYLITRAIENIGRVSILTQF